MNLLNPQKSPSPPRAGSQLTSIATSKFFQDTPFSARSKNNMLATARAFNSTDSVFSSQEHSVRQWDAKEPSKMFHTVTGKLNKSVNFKSSLKKGTTFYQTNRSYDRPVLKTIEDHECHFGNLQI